MVLDRSGHPYYDDFNPDKLFYQILSNPGRAVQARELSQIQSLLQNQIQKFGEHVFKDGSVVLGGETAVDIKYPFIKLENNYSGVPINLANFVNQKIVGTTSGTIAYVLQTVNSDFLDPHTLYLRIETGDSSQSASGSITNGSNVITGISLATGNLNAGTLVTGSGIPVNTFITEILSVNSVRISNAATATNGSAGLTFTTSGTFVDGESISTISTTLTQGATLLSTNASGLGSKVQIKRGVYFVRGFFCLVDDQTILLDKYSDTPSYKIGLSINDSFVTAQQDPTLNDPAAGSYNFNAPGADRYKIELQLIKVDIDNTTIENFVELIRIKDGIIQKQVNRPMYSELEKTLARRTYDESGDYTVRNFPVQLKEHLNTGSNGGVYTSTDGGDESKFVVVVESGKAYVRGFEIELQDTLYLDVDKSRETKVRSNYTTTVDFGNSIDVTNLRGTFNISQYEMVNLLDDTTNGNIIGVARVRGLTFVSGTPNVNAIYRLNLFDVNMSGGNNFYDVKEIVTASASASIVLTDGFAILNNVESSIAIVPLPDAAVKTLEPNGLGDTTYIVKRYYTGTLVGSDITFTANSNEIFQAGNIINYHVSIVSASGTAIGNGYSNGDVINMTTGGNSITLGGSPTGRQVTLSIPAIAGSSVAVVASLRKNSVQQKTKTLTNRTQTIAFSSLLQLDKSDIYRVTSVIDLTTSEDISQRFLLDNGQRDNYYDRGSLQFISSYPTSAGNVQVNYQYYEHGAGDYFSVDSYSGVIDYKNIHIYVSRSSGQSYDLINCMDFRPRVNDAGNGFSAYSEFVAPQEDIVLDYEYYLGRIDKLFLDQEGNFMVIKGTNSITPVPPAVPDNGMVLCQFTVPPYTFRVDEIKKQIIDNRRYTMRDIGKLDKRITNLEYYTTLSLLEKDTESMFIDDGTGNNRFKNGFIVDNFKSHIVGDVALYDYQCSMDTENGYLRPQFFSKNVGYDLSTGDSANYVQTGDLITLPYTSVSMISQPFASMTENINPYAIFNWVGTMNLTPTSDDWYETDQVPDIIVETDDGLSNAYAHLNGQVIWNDWEVSWIGQELSRVPVTTSTTTSSTSVAGSSSFVNSFGRVPDQIIGTASHFGNSVELGGVTWIRSGEGDNTVGSMGGITVGLYRDTVTREVGETRTGLQTNVVSKVTTEVIDEKILDTSVIPFIRARTVGFSGTRLKPNTTVYPFFDKIPVSQYCRPIGGNLGDPLITDSSGNVVGEFEIPNDDTLKFRTGSRIFKLIDNSSNNITTATTSAASLYRATGILQTKQNTVLSTRTAELVQVEVSSDRVGIVSQVEETLRAVTWSDPLAQTFLIEQEGGVFLSKIDIYFATKDSTGIPVTLQLRNVVNGYPGQQIIPFGEVNLTPDQVNVSDDASIATSFTFPSPVYLQNSQEYCFVLLANTQEYNVHVSLLGGVDTMTGEYITSQPYAGVMFKSQNASTWTAAQEQDLKFEIFRCSFNTGVVGNVVFKNQEIPAQRIPLDALFTTDTSTTVEVYLPNHGLQTGDETTIAGTTGTLNGIPSSEINGQHTITFVSFDRFSFTVTTPATGTGGIGGNNMSATINYRMDAANFNIQNLNFPDTSLDIFIKSTNELGNLATNWSEITLANNLSFVDSQLVLSEDNEGVDKSLQLRASMASNNENLSPVIDTQRMSAIVIGNRINYIDTDELEPKGGKAIAKYITKKISLTTEAEGAHIYFAAVRPAGSQIKVYLKSLRTDSEENFDDQPYVEVPATNYPASSSSKFVDYAFELDGINPFTIFSVKIVMLSTDTADVPVIKDFRCIATGT